MQKIHAMIHRLHNPDAGILFLRIAIGLVFVHAGWLKLGNMDMIVAGFGAAGIPAGLAYLVAYSEFICGIAMLSGLFVRYAGIILSIIMIVAITKVHLPHGYGLQGGGYEYTLTLLLCSLAMVTFGAGAYSVARMLRK